MSLRKGLCTKLNFLCFCVCMGQIRPLSLTPQGGFIFNWHIIYGIRSNFESIDALLIVVWLAIRRTSNLLQLLSSSHTTSQIVWGSDGVDSKWLWVNSNLIDRSCCSKVLFLRISQTVQLHGRKKGGHGRYSMFSFLKYYICQKQCKLNHFVPFLHLLHLS